MPIAIRHCDFRHFRVDRIQSAESAEVERPSSAPAQTPEKIDFELKVIRPTRDVAERFEQGDLQAGDIFKGSSFSQHWIARSVSAAGGAVELLSPAEIRSELANRAQSILNRYQG
jgi:proteasome accessory factor C